MTVLSLYERLELRPLGPQVHLVLRGRISPRNGQRSAVPVESVDRGNRREILRRAAAIASAHGLQWVDDPQGLINRERGPYSYRFDASRKGGRW